MTRDNARRDDVKSAEVKRRVVGSIEPTRALSSWILRQLGRKRFSMLSTGAGYPLEGPGVFDGGYSDGPEIHAVAGGDEPDDKTAENFGVEKLLLVVGECAVV